MSKIILQNIDNIEEYYVPESENDIICINSDEFIYGQFIHDKKDDKKDDKLNKLNKLNNYLKKYKFINTCDILYTFYDIYNDNIIKCIIAKYKKESDNNSIYIIQIKDDFLNNNNKLFKKKNKEGVVNDKLEEIYKNTHLIKLL